MFPEPILSYPQLCIFIASIQAEATVISQQGFILLQPRLTWSLFALNHHACPSKPNLNDRIV